MANLETAISLMKMALALLDAESEKYAAAMLQHSISIVDREPVPKEIEGPGISDAFIHTRQ